MEFWRLYRVVVARRWIILALVLLALVTVVAAKKIADDRMQYTAFSIVYPSTEAMKAGGMFQDNKSGVLGQTYDRPSRLSLFIQSIKGQQDTALDSVAEPPLEQKREIARALSNQLSGRDRVRYAGPKASEATIDALLKHYRVPTDPAIWTARTVTPEMQQEVRDSLEDGVFPRLENSVNQTPGANNPTPTMTDYIQIQVHATNPQFALQIANLLAARFINYYHDSGAQAYQAQKSQAAEAQRQANKTLDRAQTALVNFEQQTGIVNLPLQSTNSVNNLQSLQQSRDQAQTQFAAASQSVAELTNQLRSTPPTLDTKLNPQARPEVQQAEVTLEKEQAALQTMADRYTPDYPPLQHARQQLKHDQAAYQKLLAQPYVSSTANPRYAQVQTELGTARNQMVSAQATLKALDQRINVLKKSNSSTIPEAEKRLAKLQNAFTTAKNNKQAADKAYYQLVATNKEFNSGLITLTNPAEMALPDTTGPSLAALLVYAGILSLIIGVGIALGLDYLDNRVQTAGDAEKLLGMPISALIPALPSGDPRQVTRLLVTDPLSPGAEAYRLLRTDLLFTAEDKPFKSLMCATAKPGQGATTTICNLAVALAQIGKRVILIDADLRRPHLHDYFGTSNETGLTTLLRNECELEEALKITDVDNLLLLPSGPLPLNPAELLASPRMRTLHERMKPHTDFILIDTPSAIAFSDSAILASFMDAVLLVMRAQEAPRGGEGRVKEMLAKARANVVGVVLNGVKPQLVDSYYYHSAYYPQITTAPPPTAGALPPPVVEEAPLGLSAPVANAPTLPEPTGARDGYEPTLMGVRLNHAHLHLSKTATAEPSADATSIQPAPDFPAAVNLDDEAGSTREMKPLVETKPSRSRFSLRTLFGTDDQNGHDQNGH